MNLHQLGFTGFFQQQTDNLEGEPARVTRVSGPSCEVRGAHGEHSVHIPKALPGRPVVAGDWVLTVGEGHDRRVEHLLERRTAMVRRAAGRQTRPQVIAANVDFVWIVTGLDGDFNPRRIQRYVALAHESGAMPVVLLTKAAITEGVDAKFRQAQSVATHVPVHAIDVLAGVGNDALGHYVDGTIAVVGSSGAGKSTLVNHLLGQSVARTTAVRAHDSRGRHTTTHRELFWLPGGGAVIDTPGMRELQLWIEGDGIEQTFGEVADLAKDCRFSDCTHQTEPGCRVSAAVHAGELDQSRVDDYLALAEEAERTRRRRTEHERRADERAFGRMVRNAKEVKRHKF